MADRKITHVLSRQGGGKPVANALKAKAHNEGIGVPRRHFFGLSTEERREVLAEAAAAVKLSK